MTRNLVTALLTKEEEKEEEEEEEGLPVCLATSDIKQVLVPIGLVRVLTDYEITIGAMLTILFSSLFTIWCIRRWWYLTGKVRLTVSDTARPGNAVSSPKGPTLYANLNISGRQFRLLTILSTKPEISCRLEVAEFGDELSFNALSYVWGDPTVTETILVNEHRIQVTKNLISALRYAPYHLSRSKNATSLKLWVDAICINQMDRTEKGHQVSMMKDIYSQSSIVLCWLGSPTDRIHTAMDAVQAVAHQRHIRCADVMYHENQHELLDSFEQLQSHLKRLHVIDAKPFVEETSLISGIVGDVEIHAVANALQHTTKAIFVILQKPHGSELELCRPALLRAFHELTNWHNQFHERASKLDDTLREHSHPIGFLLALLSYRVRKFSQMCQEYLYQRIFDEAYTNLLWLEQFPWLLEVKEVVGESPTGPAQPLFDVAYWSRIWIRQEIILAHHPVFVCGFRSFSLETIESFAVWVKWMVAPSNSALLKKAEASKLVKAYLPICQLLHHIFESRRTMGLPTNCLFCPEDIKTNIWWASPGARATDPKDYYYGFLGLTNLELVPDYASNISVGLVCQKFMNKYLTSSLDQTDRPVGGPLGLLMFAGVGYGWDADPDMPSWGPNFPGQAQAKTSSRGDSDAIIALDKRGFDCIFEARSDAMITGCRMDVSVLILDRIQAIGPRVSNYGRPELLHRTGLPITWPVDFAIRHKSYVSGGHPLTAFRTLLEPSSLPWYSPDGFPAEDCLDLAKYLAMVGRPIIDEKSRVAFSRLCYLKDLFDQIPIPTSLRTERGTLKILAQ
ncbi:hypothetical protein FOYG_00042 [Fusarium oxysporum NRRL 32931]|uniref:Heterokaryon incompatibility domain-containing protein n=1 Tax=Fusarium oxysporum NRRL 32931 TaxID=660029 RepID=W9IZI4_FUSOX|nr:hypothetical protein FOYG_00042 [Fusarium oxysporum NRRL 32931]